jgi:predicted ATP-grasp superfamily ATP-dependent carboligase
MAVTLVVAGVWARPLAESACQAGWRVIALDLFGDADTRRASAWWARVGDPATFTIDPVLLREALQRAARERGVLGWVAGSGFEGQTEALALRVPGLPLLGMDGAAIRRVRDPATFFATLDALGLPHPAISLARPADSAGWLVKHCGGSGGWHIQRADESDTGTTEGTYWQRLQPGDPLSALFLADGTRARIVALNRLLVRPLGTRPFVYHGAVGPLRDDSLAARMEDALAALVPAFGLRGMASLDFIAHDGRAWLLEVNPRPSSTMVLHAHAWDGGLMRAHVAAVQGRLPDGPPADLPGLRGCLTVYAPHPCRMGLALSAELALSPDCHDQPAPGARFATGEPICTVSASAPHLHALLAALDARAEHVREQLGAFEEIAL